jgi:hypothetical protein
MSGKEPWMETVTPGKFSKFQHKIFPIVEVLVSKPEHAANAFTKKWNNLKRKPKTLMSAGISWRNLKILMGIETLLQYKDFLVQCPGFGECVRIVPSKSTRSGFNYGVIQQQVAQTTAGVIDTTDKDGMTILETDDDSSYITDMATLEQFSNKDKSTISGGGNNSGISPIDLLETPKRTNVAPMQEMPQTLAQPDNTDESNTTLATTDVMGIPDNVTYMTHHETSGFCRVHYRMFENITTWMQCNILHHTEPGYF